MTPLNEARLKIQSELITLSHAVGEERRQLAILGEGNTSALCGDGVFWVKASGSQLGNLTPEGLSLVDLEKALSYMRNETMSDDAVKDALKACLIDSSHRVPSVETMVHAVCLSVGGAKWVAHTHAISCNAILCSKAGAQPFMGHLFPDGIVVCGRHVAVVPYVDPGFALAKEFEKAILRFQDAYGVNPKLVLMENHGIASLGQTATEALNIQLMADKWARVLSGTAAFGGPQYLPESVADRIENRPDEHYRRKVIAPQ